MLHPDFSSNNYQKELKLRERFLNSQFNSAEIELLKSNGMYSDYVQGYISINRIYNQFKEQGI